MASRILWPELGEREVKKGWLPVAAPLTTRQVLDAIAKRHDMSGFGGRPGRWVFCVEVQSGTGSYGDVQRFDAIAVGLVPSVKYARVIYEVKVSRSDWLRELKPISAVTYNGRPAGRMWDEPADLEARGYVIEERSKWQTALNLSTEFWVAAPPEVVLEHELPPEAGLVEVRPYGRDGALRPRIVRKAPVRQTPMPGPEFWAAVLRRAAERSGA